MGTAATMVVLTIAVSIAASGWVACVVACSRARARRRAELRSTESLRAVVNTTRDAVFTILAPGAIASWNPAAARLLGYQPDEIIGRDGSVLLPEGHLPFLDRLSPSRETGGEGGTGPGDRTIRDDRAVILHRDGHQIPACLTMSSIVDPGGALSGVSVIARSTSWHCQDAHVLQGTPHTDPLTGLADRELLLDHLASTLNEPRLPGECAALIVIDVDDFKFVNDTLGHYLGDRLLISVSHRLRGCVRSADLVARLGGDEFAIVLRSVTEEGVRCFAHRVIAALTPAIELDGTPVSGRASMGAALYADGEDDTPDTLLSKADLAMYAAKRECKGGFRIFADELRSAFTERVELETDLRQAVRSQQFHLHYQPIVSLVSGEITGFEALLRWNRPNRAPVGPAIFIPVLESTGLITEVGEFVLQKACLQTARWHSDIGVPISVSVNVSPPQLNEPAFVDRVQYALTSSTLPPSSLTLEITEGVMVANVEQVVAKLTQLRALGVRMAIDDFGTGYSSLSYLQTLPVDTVKIDRSFIAKIQYDHVQAALASAIIGVGHALKLAVVAEGIETEEQARLLRTIGCEYGQGFHFARPQDPGTVATMLANAEMIKV